MIKLFIRSIYHLCDCNLEGNLQLAGNSSGNLSIYWCGSYASRWLSAETFFSSPCPFALRLSVASKRIRIRDRHRRLVRKEGWHVAPVSPRPPVHLSEPLSPLRMKWVYSKTRISSTSWTSFPWTDQMVFDGLSSPFNYLPHASSASPSLQNKKSDQFFCWFGKFLTPEIRSHISLTNLFFSHLKQAASTVIGQLTYTRWTRY